MEDRPNDSSKVECVFPVVIWSELRLRQHRDDDHLENALHFTSQHPKTVMLEFYDPKLVCRPRLSQILISREYS